MQLPRTCTMHPLHYSWVGARASSNGLSFPFTFHHNGHMPQTLDRTGGRHSEGEPEFPLQTLTWKHIHVLACRTLGNSKSAMADFNLVLFRCLLPRFTPPQSYHISESKHSMVDEAVFLQNRSEFSEVLESLCGGNIHKSLVFN